MSDAPNRIGLVKHRVIGGYRLWNTLEDGPNDADVEYIPADEAIAALKACVTAMEHPSHAVTQGAIEWARKVIAETEGGT